MTILNDLKKNRTVSIECPECGEQMCAAEAQLFDATKELVDAAADKLDTLHAQLASMKRLHNEEVAKAKQRTFVAARATNIGKTVEKIAPSLAGFPEQPSDCRSLFEPIDYLVFRGLRSGLVDSLAFVDIKSGRARLSDRQKSVRDLLANGRLSMFLVPVKRTA